MKEGERGVTRLLGRGSQRAATGIGTDWLRPLYETNENMKPLYDPPHATAHHPPLHPSGHLTFNKNHHQNIV